MAIVKGRKPKESVMVSWGLDSKAVYGKHCSRCKVLKAYERYDKLWRSSDGRQPLCKTCKRDLNRLRDRRKFQ